MISTTGAIAMALAAGLYVDGRTRFSRDFLFSLSGLKAKYLFRQIEKNKDFSIYNRFEEQCHVRPFAVAMIFEDHSYTWRDLELASNRMAHWYLSKGIQPRDRVAMFMKNSPLFVISWLALLKIKAVAAFINNQINGPVLLHSLKTADAKMLIFDHELAEPLEESYQGIIDLGYVMYTITPKEEVFHPSLIQAAGNGKAPNEDSLLYKFMEWRHLSTEGFPKETRADVTIDDAVALIYTSGTTGFPKAAVMDHGRCTMGASAWSLICGIQPNDRVYNCLPLYHSAGAIIGIGQTWFSGSTVVLSKKFSATRFWEDCRHYEVTHFQYIGELCRFLLNAPEHPLDKHNNIRLMFGNGMRPDVWRKFQERFNIPAVFESYTMSEATSALFNLSHGPDGAGAVGFRGPLVRTFQPGIHIVKVDMDTEELIKDKDGYCIECAPGETGELIALADNSQPYARFKGYYGQKRLSEAKLIRNVFKQGDQYMRSGDLLYRTKDHFWYFADRAGDTYRWKGENVATAEISDTLGYVDGINSCTVYGVQIPGQDGRAGMAAIVLNDQYWEDKDAWAADSASTEAASSPPWSQRRRLKDKDLSDFVDRLSKHAAKRLPSYAIPRFVRIMEGELEITGTFKNKKVELKKEGYDLTKCKDGERLFWWNPAQARYESFGQKENEIILAGRARL